jgi:AcrR family transcriptional regulator
VIGAGLPRRSVRKKLKRFIFAVNINFEGRCENGRAMAGLRERQKADRERRILKVAVTRFRAGGYHAVRMEDLAFEAEVSVGTVYNYYRTKGDLLIAAVALEVEEVLAAAEALLADPPRDAAEALEALTFGYFDHSLSYLSKEMWRMAMALSIEAPATPNGAHYNALDRKLAAQVVRMIRALQARGDVAHGIDAAVAGRIAFNNLNQEFTEFVKDDSMTLAQLRARVGAQTRLIAAALRPEATA